MIAGHQSWADDNERICYCLQINCLGFFATLANNRSPTLISNDMCAIQLELKQIQIGFNGNDAGRPDSLPLASTTPLAKIGVNRLLTNFFAAAIIGICSNRPLILLTLVVQPIEERVENLVPWDLGFIIRFNRQQQGRTYWSNCFGFGLVGVRPIEPGAHFSQP